MNPIDPARVSSSQADSPNVTVMYTLVSRAADDTPINIACKMIRSWLSSWTLVILRLIPDLKSDFILVV